MTNLTRTTRNGAGAELTDPVASEQRFAPDRPCPICGGHPDLPKGEGVRCRGWLGNGTAFCTREECAGDLPRAGESDAYAHALVGPCGCGKTHGEAGCTLEQYAELKKLPVEVLRGFGLTQMTYQSAPAVRIPYLDTDGSELATQYRVGRERDPRHKFKAGDKPHLYGRWRRDEAVAAGRVTLVEGASDCHTLWFQGEPAVGLPGAGTFKEARDGTWFEGIPEIFVVVEPDSGGDTVLRWLAKAPFRDRARLVDLSLFGAKDPSELHCLDPDRFAEPWAQALADAVAWADLERKERERLADEAANAAGGLLDDPDLFARVGAAMAGRGYAGDLQPPLLAFLAITSRLTKRPINVAFVARASSGKNRAVDAAVELMPPEAYYAIGAASERALIYNDEPYEHRVVVFNEADSIPEEGPAATAIRNLAADNAMRYEVTEQDPITKRFTTRLIDKSGPTGLITTSTRSLGDQLGTRVLEATITDSEEQTRRIMEAQARDAMGLGRAEPDPAPFVALQRWLALAGERRVAMPFALALANLIPAKAVRMRRDFPKLLTAVKTAAMLHQRRRDRDSDGAVVASIEDYAAARALLAPVFDAITAEGLTPAIRQTVEAVAPGEEDVTIAALMARLSLEKPSVWYRVRKACAGGWLVNAESKKGQPARLRRGDPLPETAATLPLPDAVVQEVARINVSPESEEEVPPSPSLAEEREAMPNLEEGGPNPEEDHGGAPRDAAMACPGGGGIPSQDSGDTLIPEYQDDDSPVHHQALEGCARANPKACIDCGAVPSSHESGSYCGTDVGQPPEEADADDDLEIPETEAVTGDEYEGGLLGPESSANPPNGVLVTAPNGCVPDGCGQAHVCRDLGPCGPFRDTGECWNVLRARRAAEEATR